MSPSKSISTQSSSSYSSFGSGQLTTPPGKSKKAVRRGSLGTAIEEKPKRAPPRGSLGTKTATANATAIVTNIRSPHFIPALEDDDASVHSVRTTRSLSSFGARRMLGLTFLGSSKGHPPSPVSPLGKPRPFKQGEETKKDPAGMRGRLRSKSPTTICRSKTPVQKAAPVKSPLTSPTKKKVISKASKQMQKQKMTDGPMEPAGTLKRLDSGCFHAPYSSSEDEGNNSKEISAQFSPTSSASPRSDDASPRGRQLQKTWSCSALSVNSAGENSAQTNLYFDEDDSTDFDTDDEADRVMSRDGSKKKMKKDRRGKRAPRRMTKKQRKREKEAKERAAKRAEVIPEAIQEDDEDDESGDESDPLHFSPANKSFSSPYKRDLHDFRTSDILNNSISSHDDLDDIVSSCSYQMPAFGTVLGLEPVRKIGLSPHAGTGYSSDSSVVRKRMELVNQQQLEKRKEEKKGKKKKKSPRSNKRDPSMEKTISEERSLDYGRPDQKQVRAFHESFVNYGYDEPDEVSVRSSKSAFIQRYANIETSEKETVRIRSSSQCRSKKDKKKKKRTSKRSSSTTGSTISDEEIYGEDFQNSFGKNASFSTSNSEEVNRRMLELDHCFKNVDQQARALGSPRAYDKRYQEIEKFEAFLFEERNKLQKERATIAFERESLELQLIEENIKSESLSLQVKELEHELKSMRLSHAGNSAEMSMELDDVKADFQRQMQEMTWQLREKEKEIQGLKSKEVTARSNHSDASSHSGSFEGKSRDRLQGELLQTTSKLMEKQQLADRQQSEIERLREELTGMRNGSGVAQLKDEISELTAYNIQLENDLDRERKDSVTKLKEKDETITYLMGELARLKQEQSRDLNSSNHSRNSVSSLSNLRRGSLSGSATSFLPPGLFNAP